MITAVAQRWRARRDSYRPAGEVIDTRRHEVAAIADDTTPRAFVEAHHYSGTYPAARFRFGLYRGAVLVGVAVFSQPTNNKTLTNVFPVKHCDIAEASELGRLVLLDLVEGNAETWFIARCFDLLRREGQRGVLSFSDPTPRTTSDGRRVFRGHIGGIYQAHNALYLGRATARTLHLLPDGSVANARTVQKIRAGERGWRAAVEQLVEAGAPPFAGDPCEWVRAALASTTRKLRHQGCHRYAWALDRRLRRELPPGQPYPKYEAAA